MAEKAQAPPRTFVELLYRSFMATYGPFLTVVGFVLTVIAFFVVPATATWPVRWMLVLAVLAAYAVLVLLYAAYTAFRTTGQRLPIVRCAQACPKAFHKAKVLFLLDPSELFAHDAIVSIYYMQDDIERLIGMGRVINIQEDGRIQVLATHDVEFGDVQWQDLVKNDVTKLRRLIVKPIIPAFALEAYRNE